MFEKFVEGVTSFWKRVSKRKLEAYVSSFTLAVGIYLALPFESMDSQAYATLRDIAPEGLWAWLFISNGLSHIMWILVNGHRWWSPLARWGSCVFSALLYTAWVLGFALYDPTTTAIVGYTWPALASIVCCVTAWRDALFSIRVRDAYAK